MLELWNEFCKKEDLHQGGTFPDCDVLLRWWEYVVDQYQQPMESATREGW
jgi:hypothetical protein